MISSNGGAWVLGLPFLSNYYSIWDHDGGASGQLGLVLPLNSNASISQVTSLPTRTFKVTAPPSPEVTHESIWSSVLLTGEIVTGIIAGLGVAGTVFLVVYVVLYETDVI